MQEATSSENEILCNGADFPCFGRSGGPGAAGRQNDGTGWVKVNLSSGGIVLLPALPVDPVNNANYHYTYCASDTGWEINATLESEQLGIKTSSDGGNDADSFEVGSDYFLISPGGGSCEY
ncbi:MAG: hypothetical protein NUV73_01200 [Candidatus Daviesbacteria bacterium]|nr:hypothetical protein [Candidatus Daviesbacteria bacterium]